MKVRLFTCIFMILLFMALLAGPVSALPTITVKNGKNITVNSTSLQAPDCVNVILESGSSIILNSASIIKMGKKTGPGEFIVNGDSRVARCSFVFLPPVLHLMLLGE